MKRQEQHGRKAAKFAVSVVAVLAMAWTAPEPVKALPSTAQRFVENLGVVQAGGEKMTFWDRVMYSLVLAGDSQKRQAAREKS